MAAKKVDKQDLNSQMIAHLMPPYIPRKSLEEGGLLVLTEGKGNTVTDIEGRQYLDAVSGGVFAVSLGYGREEIAKAIYEQCIQLVYVNPYNYVTSSTVQLATRLAEVTPGNLSVTFFSNSGSDANEAAFRIAKQYHYHTGNKQRYKVISRLHAYHGSTQAALSATGPGPFYTKIRALAEPLVPGFSHIPAPYCYRCDFGLEYPNCNLECAKALQQEIELQGPELVSAFIGEPIMGSGFIIPPPEYWPMIRSICDQYSVLLIDDEVICGFGRTGKWFACEHWNIVPDIMTMGKNISGAYIPLAATIVTNKIAEGLPSLAHVYTYGGHAVTCAAGLASLEIIKKERLVENSAEIGSYLLEGLKTLIKYPVVGEVRGLGTLCLFEVVKDRKTREKFPVGTRPGGLIAIQARKHGVIVRAGGPGDFIQVAPALTFTKKDVDTVVEVLDRSIAEVKDNLGKKIIDIYT